MYEHIFASAWKLRLHSRSSGQKATEWIVDPFALSELEHSFTATDHLTREPNNGRFRFMGLPVQIDTHSPVGRMVLKAGENTVGAFNVDPSAIDA